MKIVFLVNQDIHALKCLNLLLENLKNHEVEIYATKKVGKGSKIKALQELSYQEKIRLEEVSWELEKQQKKARFLTFNQIANYFNCKIHQPENINSEEECVKLQKMAPDLIISIRFGQILQENVIKIPKLGVINLHSGILPKYRGVLASFWAILSKEEEIGSTLHYIDDSKIDSGAIINISRQKLAKDRSLIYNVFSLYDEGCDMIKDFLQGKKSSFAKESKNQYFSYPSQEDVENFQTIMPLASKKDCDEIYDLFKP